MSSKYWGISLTPLFYSFRIEKSKDMLLYRGVSKKMDADLKGKLLPKGTKAKVAARHDRRVQHDGKFSFGESEDNAVRAQHIKSGLYEGCYISTTKSEDEARRFATSDFTEPGWVYVINSELFEKHDVKSKEFDDHLVPHEREVTIRARNCGAIPKEVIIKKYAVASNGSTID
jgi:hypothetical protein